MKNLTVQKKAIVLGEDYVALGVIKALAKEGIKVILMTSKQYDHAYYSRFVSERVKVPNPKDASDKLLALLLETPEKWHGALLLPATDENVIFISQNRDALSRRYVFTIQNWEVINAIINKCSLYSQAQQIGIPTPRFLLPKSIQCLEQRQNDLFYPCIIKPCERHWFEPIYGEKVLRIHDYQELVEKFLHTQQHKLKVMVSEIVPGDDSSLFHYRSYIDHRGSVLAEMCTQKIRQHPTDFGRASVSKTVPMIPEIRNLALDLLASFSYHGESSAEFRLDYRDKQYKLMEINVRPVLPEWHFVAAGINFPYITYLDLVHNAKIPSPIYQHEIYWIHNLWEAADFIKMLRSKNFNLRDFLRPYWKKKVFCVPFFDDPIHFIITVWFATKKVLKKFKDNISLKRLKTGGAK